MKMLPNDEINEKNIDTVLNYLKVVRPDKATPEVAIRILETMSVGAHKAVAHGDKVDIERAINDVLRDIEK